MMITDEPIIAEGRGYRLTRLPLATEMIAIFEMGKLWPHEAMAMHQIVADGNFIDDRHKKPVQHKFIFLDGTPRP